MRLKPDRITSRLTTIGSRTPQAPKLADPYYLTPEHRAWSDMVIRRAGGRCEWPGCTKAQPQYRMFADHIRERRDGGDPLDPANGMCLCGSHHTAKTAAARTRRQQGMGV